MSSQSIPGFPALIEDSPYRGLSLSVFSENLSLPRHRWYAFKQGFSARLVETALDAISAKYPRPRVLDPFAGAGTTLLCSMERGLPVRGIEANPFLVFLSRSKTVAGPWDERAFQAAVAHVLDADQADGVSELEGFSTFTEREGLDKWLFNRDILRQFFACSRRLGEVEQQFAKPLLVSLLVAAFECSNVKRDGKCLRYRKGWRNNGHDGQAFRDSFRRHSSLLVEDVRAVPLEDAVPCNMLHGDARVVLPTMETASADLVVTSPPYLNSFDYTDVYRPELFLGGFVTSAAELRRLRHGTIRSHVQVAWAKTREYESSELDAVVAALRQQDLWDPRLPDMVQAYFDDLLKVLTELHRIVAPGGQVWFTVGTSAYATVHVLVDLLLAQLGQEAGFDLEGVHVLRSMRSSGQHWKLQPEAASGPLRESLIIWTRQ